MLIVILPVSNVSAQPDGFEYFVHAETNIQRADSDMDGYFETARIYYDVDSTTAYAEIKVVCSVYDLNTTKLVKELSESYTIFRQVDFKDTYFDFKASYSGTFDFILAVYDIAHNKKEYGGNDYPAGNISLEVNPYGYRIIPDATAYDADADGYNDDVRIIVYNNYNYTMSNVSVYIDAEYRGETDANGQFLRYNLERGIHEVDVFYRGLHGNTDFKSEGTGQQMALIYSDADPFDDDQDGYIDDVVIQAFAYNYYPLPNADVYIDNWYYGATNQQGIFYAYDFQKDFHYVSVNFRSLWTFTSFYAEAENITDNEEYFFDVRPQIVALDPDRLMNDIDIYLDVDVANGKTSNVTVNATVYYENRTIAATGTTNYTTTGSEIEDEHIYIYNLTNNLTYAIICELFDEHGNLEDVYYQDGLVIQVAYGKINVDNAVLDLQDDDHFNDVTFQAHIKDVGYVDASIKIYYKSNHSLAQNLSTNRRDGVAVATNLLYTNYTWIAHDIQNNEIDNGTFELYDRNPFRTAQVRVLLSDWDRDMFFDDFQVNAYNDLNRFEYNVSVQITDFETKGVVAQGFTSIRGEGNVGRFLVEDLPEGFYTYTASIIFGLSEYHLLSSGWFYSYGNSTQATRLLNAFAIGFDLDGDGYQNDVRVRVTDRNNQPVMNAIVFYDNDIQTQNTTDQNGITFARDFSLGWHDVNVVFLGNSPTVPRGAQAHTRFYSEGLDYDEFFWYVEASHYSADNDDEWNDLNISIVLGVNGDAEVDVVVEIEIHFTSNDSLAKQKSLNLTYSGDYIGYSLIYNLTYNEIYYANYTLKDSRDKIEDEESQVNITVYPIEPIINVDMTLNQNKLQNVSVSVNTVVFNAHILEHTIIGIRVEIYFKNNDSLAAEARTGTFPPVRLDDGDYYYKAKNETNDTIEYGEFNIGNNPATVSEMQYNLDEDGFYDDFEYFAFESVYPNAISLVNLTIVIYDAFNNLVAQGSTASSWNFTVYNLTLGIYSFNATYQGQRVSNGTFYSYGNGFPNLPPVAIISEPKDGSIWNTTDIISFDGSQSYDPDVADVITFYWVSNISGHLSNSESFTRKLPAGVHEITLYVDDGRGNEHNVTDSVVITISKPTSPNQPPVADAGDDQDNVPVNTKVTLDGSGSYDPDNDNITRYEWLMESKPSGSTAAIDNPNYVKPNFTADKIGDYMCSLRVRDENNAWSSKDFVNITVIENQVPIVNISLPEHMDLYNTTDTIFFESNGTYDPDDDTDGNGTIDGSETDNLDYRWTMRRKGNNTTVEIGTLPNFNISDVNTVFGDGTFIINLSVEDQFDANASTEVEINITNVPPIANITSPTENELFKKFKRISFDGTASLDADNDTLELYYYWVVTEFGESTPLLIFENNSAPAIFDGLKEGNYTVTLWVDDGFGTDLFDRAHNVSTMVNFSVENQAPVPKFSMSYPNDDYPNTINWGEFAFFNASKSSDPDGPRDVENFTYYWDFNASVDEDEDGNTTNDEELEGIAVNFSFTEGALYGTIYVVTLTVDDGSDYNNIATTNLTIRINNIPNADAGEDITDAEVGEPILLDGSDSWDLDKDLLEFKWTFDEEHKSQDTEWSTSPYANVTYDDPSDEDGYTATLSVRDGMGTDNASIQIIVIKANSPPNVNAGSDVSNADVGQVLNFSGIVSDPDEGDVLTYKWDFGDDTPQQQGINVSHSYQYNGRFTVVLNVTDGEAWANDTLTVTVRPEPPVIDDPGDSVNKIVTITGSLKDSARDITKVEIKIGSKQWAEVIPKDADDWSEWSYDWDTTKDENKEYTIQVRAVTSYATSKTTSIDVSVANAAELSITITTPNNNANLKATVTIRGTTTGEDIESVEVKIGTGGTWILAEDDSAAGDWSAWRYIWDTTTEDDKSYRISARVTAGGETKEVSVTVKVDNVADAEPVTDESTGLMDTIMENLALVVGGLILLIIIILLIIASVTRKKKQRRLLEEEERLEKEELEEKEILEVEKEEEVLEIPIKKQPVRCPKCKEYSVIEDDGQRPLMIECVHCGTKGYISEGAKTLGAPKLPSKEEDKLIIQCPKCEEMFTVDDEVGEIECPSCGAKGHLDEETLEELRAQRELTETEPDMDLEGPPEKPEEPETKELEKPEKRLRCPNCDTKFYIPADAKKIECPSCGATGTL